MANYVNEQGEEFTSAHLGCGVLMFFIAGLVLSGAIAAVPALFGAAVAAAWVWGVLAFFTLVTTLVAYGNARRLLTKVEK